MRGFLVAIDLETTGLDAAEAHIIEIGAAKFRDNEIVETFTTLVDPGVSIPPKVTDITGLRNEDMVGAPKIRDVLPRLVELTGDALIVGHNVEFDLRFLHRQNVLQTNPAIDTYELASVLLPTTARYNLNALMQVLNIAPEGNYHRALTDAIASARLYMTLWDKLLRELPIDLLQEIARLAKPLLWGGKLPFEAALKVREGERLSKTDPVMRAFKAPERKLPMLSPAPNPLPLDPAMLASQLPADPSYRAAALGEVAGAFNDNACLMLETPDDAQAWWLPAAEWAMRNGERVVIAAGNERIGRLMAELPGPASATILRRRTQYLCPARLQTVRRQGPATSEELRLLAKILVWMAQTADPEAERLSVRGPGEQAAWVQFSAEIEGCAPSRCETQMGGICPLFKDYQAAESAHLIFVDHEMLVADAAGADPLLPGYRRVIVDQAHLLEDAATEGLHTRMAPGRIRRTLDELGTRGLLGDMLTDTKPMLPEKTHLQIEQFIGTVSAAAAQMAHHLDSLFKAIMAFLEATSDTHPTGFAIQVRLSSELRSKPAFGQVRAAWSILSQFTDTLAGAMGQLARRLVALTEKYNLPADLRPRAEAAARQMTRIHRWLDSWISGQGENQVYWAEISPDTDRPDRLSLHAAPLRVSVPLKRSIWDKVQTAVITGATLRTGGNFDYLRSTYGLDGARQRVIPASADGKRSILVYLPGDMPEPNERERYQRAVERGIIELATALDGRMLALFTSYTQLRQSGQQIAARLALGNINVFDQSDGTAQSALLEGFRATERGVLLGVRGFWEDIPFTPDELAALVIVRLPFAVPSDPVFAARSELFDDPLNQYTVPAAALRFRQSFEILSRMQRPRGVVAILDRRMTSKEYGQTFLDSLPPCEVRRASLADLPGAAREWLQG